MRLINNVSTIPAAKEDATKGRGWGRLPIRFSRITSSFKQNKGNKSPLSFRNGKPFIINIQKKKSSKSNQGYNIGEKMLRQRNADSITSLVVVTPTTLKDYERITPTTINEEESPSSLYTKTLTPVFYGENTVEVLLEDQQTNTNDYFQLETKMIQRKLFQEKNEFGMDCSNAASGNQLREMEKYSACLAQEEKKSTSIDNKERLKLTCNSKDGPRKQLQQLKILPGKYDGTKEKSDSGSNAENQIDYGENKSSNLSFDIGDTNSKNDSRPLHDHLCDPACFHMYPKIGLDSITEHTSQMMALALEATGLFYVSKGGASVAGDTLTESITNEPTEESLRIGSIASKPDHQEEVSKGRDESAILDTLDFACTTTNVLQNTYSMEEKKERNVQSAVLALIDKCNCASPGNDFISSMSTKKKVARFVEHTACCAGSEVISNRPYINEYFATKFLRKFRNNTTRILWHQPISIGGGNFKDRAVVMSIQPGNCFSRNEILPKLLWYTITEASDSKELISNTIIPKSSAADQIHSIPLLDIHSILTSVNNIDGADCNDDIVNRNNDDDDGGVCCNDNDENDHCFFVITTNLGDVYVFESMSVEERDLIVIGIKNVIARLTQHLVTGNKSAILDLYYDEDYDNPPLGELPSLPNPTKIMNRMSHRLLDD